MPYKSIKSVCSAIGTTENTLRYYDEKGLLSPSIKNEHGRHEWLYDEASLWKLRLILTYRKLGVPVEEIKRHMDRCDRSDEMLEKKLSELKAERDSLDEKIAITEMLLLVEGIAPGEENRETRNRLLDKLIKVHVEGGEDEQV